VRGSSAGSAHRLGDIAAAGEPYVAALKGVLDESAQCQHPARTTRKERVDTEIEQAAIVPHAIQLRAPHLGHLHWGFDHRTDVGIGQVGVLLPVVQGPVHRQLHDRPGIGGEPVWPVVTHEGGVVAQAVFGDEPRSLPTGTPQRGTVTGDIDALSREHGQRPFEVGAFLGGGHGHRRAVTVRVVGDLVSAFDDGRRQPGPVFGNPPWHEKGGGHGQVVEQVEDARHADVRPLGLVRHRHHVCAVAVPLGEDRCLRIDVEGQGGHRTRAAVPRRRHRAARQARALAIVAIGESMP
jgi:hypothetical protein